MAMNQLGRARTDVAHPDGGHAEDRVGLDHAEPAAPHERHHHIRLTWWKEVLLIAIVYGAYTLVRNTFGSAKLDEGIKVVALNNALHVISIERALGLFHEVAIQRWLLGTPVMNLLNLFYSIAHFVVTIVVVIWMMTTRRAAFRRWRSTLLFTTVLATIGFSMYPLMPPRLLNEAGRYGAAGLLSPSVAAEVPFSDTLRSGSTAWSFDSQPVDDLSNQYAAMPSLHMGWSLWCAIVVWKLARNKFVRWLMLLHPVVTLLAIVATANHYLLDAIGGVLTLAAGYGLARLSELIMAKWRAHRGTAVPGEALAATP
jgi:PAP2 superfamily